MKFVKQIISIICVLIMLYSLAFYANAVFASGPITEIERIKLVEALQDVELQKQL